MNYLQCDVETLKASLAEQFECRIGFCWENYATVWEIDHHKPINMLKTKPELIAEILHYKNLRPLTKAENQKKKAKIPSLLTEAKVEV
jgi:hypothetical protein